MKYTKITITAFDEDDMVISQVEVIAQRAKRNQLIKDHLSYLLDTNSNINSLEINMKSVGLRVCGAKAGAKTTDEDTSSSEDICSDDDNNEIKYSPIV